MIESGFLPARAYDDLASEKSIDVCTVREVSVLTYWLSLVCDNDRYSIAFLAKYSLREVSVSWYNLPQSRRRPIEDALRTFSELLYIKPNLLSGRYE